MSLWKNIFFIMLLVILCYPEYSFSIPAFPGAEGFGANSVGGRGGKVIKVTNLNDNGTGSFRAAVGATGKRIVVFDISGIINLQTEITITEPYLTIAGQTSPGGILITGRRIKFSTYHVVIQYVRFRVGSHRIKDGADPEKLDAVNIYGSGAATPGAHDVIFDHCSFSWGVDETFSTAYNPKDITVQWSIISEGLSNAGHPKGEHSKGFFIWGKGSPDTKVSFHHNYLAHNSARNPEVNGADGPFIDAVNNVVYNWYGGRSPSTAQQAKANWIHNYIKKGLSSNDYTFEVRHTPDSGTPLPLIYVEGNIGSTRLNQTDPQWNVGFEWRNQLLSENYRRLTPWPAPSVKTAAMSADIATCILSAVGATAPVRDSVDIRLINDFHNGTGDIIDNVIYPDDFPVFLTPSPAADIDNDGMADSWENSKGLKTNVDDSALDRNNDGYTNIEEYLNYLSVNSYTFNGNCMPMPVPIIK